MSAQIQELLAHGPVVTDGAWGTQLQKRGLPVGACPDAWNLTQPGCVEEIARAYVEAGSQIILTNTFGANCIALARHGLADQVAEINEAGAAVSRRASRGRARVFASMGATGRILAIGDVSEAEVRAAFAQQARALAQAGVDGIVVETMVDLAEAKVAVRAARETGLPVVACLVFGSPKADYRTVMGDSPEEAAAELAAAGADVIGANCGHDVTSYAGICERLRAATDLPLWIKPNAGLPRFVVGRAAHVYGTTPREFATRAATLTTQGADFIGGCCGTDPAFIRALVEALGR